MCNCNVLQQAHIVLHLAAFYQTYGVELFYLGILSFWGFFGEQPPKNSSGVLLWLTTCLLLSGKLVDVCKSGLW